MERSPVELATLALDVVVDVAFVTGVMVGIGFVLLVVPGLILACMFFVAVPVAVVERPGVFEALARSGRLTRGHRVPILGVLVATFYLALYVRIRRLDAERRGRSVERVESFGSSPSRPRVH